MLDETEQASLLKDMGNNEALILRNHGLLIAGQSVGKAFSWTHRLEVSCRSQLAAMASNSKFCIVSDCIGSDLHELPAANANAVRAHGVARAFAQVGSNRSFVQVLMNKILHVVSEIIRHAARAMAPRSLV